MASAADAAAEVAAAAKAEGHRLLMEKATRIEASLETGETEAASLRLVLANQTYQRWYQRWYDFTKDIVRFTGYGDCTARYRTYTVPI